MRFVLAEVTAECAKQGIDWGHIRSVVRNARDNESVTKDTVLDALAGVLI